MAEGKGVAGDVVLGFEGVGDRVGSGFQAAVKVEVFRYCCFMVWVVNRVVQ